MAEQPPTTVPAFDAPIPSPEERRLAGKERRNTLPRSCHAVWESSADRRDPIEVLTEANRGRMDAISGYIGSSDRFCEALADWASAYGHQTERDHAALLAAIERGILPTVGS